MSKQNKVCFSGSKNLAYKPEGMFCYMVFTILNHVTKHPTPSLDKDFTTESKACDLANCLDPEKETLVCFHKQGWLRLREIKTDYE